MPEWDGMCESYLDFKAAMMDLLVYDSEYLGLSTLKSQIVGENKAYVLSLLINVQKVKEAWLFLDHKFGNLDISQPTMLVELAKLKGEPTDKYSENKNILKILAFYNTARHHEKHCQMINTQFIFKFSNLLSKEHRKEILEKRIFNCK